MTLTSLSKGICPRIKASRLTSKAITKEILLPGFARLLQIVQSTGAAVEKMPQIMTTTKMVPAKEDTSFASFSDGTILPSIKSSLESSAKFIKMTVTISSIPPVMPPAAASRADFASLPRAIRTAIELTTF